VQLYPRPSCWCRPPRAAVVRRRSRACPRAVLRPRRKWCRAGRLVLPSRNALYRFTLPPDGGLSTRWLINVSTYVTDGELDVIGADGHVLQHQVFGSVIPVADRPVYAHELIVPVLTPRPPGASFVLRMVTPTEHRPCSSAVRGVVRGAQRQTMRDEALPLALLNGFASRWAFSISCCS